MNRWWRHDEKKKEGERIAEGEDAKDSWRQRLMSRLGHHRKELTVLKKVTRAGVILRLVVQCRTHDWWPMIGHSHEWTWGITVITVIAVMTICATRKKVSSTTVNMWDLDRVKRVCESGFLEKMDKKTRGKKRKKGVCPFWACLSDRRNCHFGDIRVIKRQCDG